MERSVPKRKVFAPKKSKFFSFKSKLNLEGDKLNVDRKSLGVYQFLKITAKMRYHIYVLFGKKLKK